MEILDLLCLFVSHKIACLIWVNDFVSSKNKRYLFPYLSHDLTKSMSKCDIIFTETYIVKPVLSSHSQEDQNSVLKTNYCLIQVESITECSR